MKDSFFAGFFSEFEKNAVNIKKLKGRGYATDTIMDYAAPFDDFAKYDLIVLSRYAVDDFTLGHTGRVSRQARRGGAPRHPGPPSRVDRVDQAPRSW